MEKKQTEAKKSEMQSESYQQKPISKPAEKQVGSNPDLPDTSVPIHVINRWKD